LVKWSMIVATTLSLHSSQNSIPLTSCPPSMFSIRYSLFFRRFSPPILCYQPHPASFLQNRGVGVTMRPESNVGHALSFPARKPRSAGHEGATRETLTNCRHLYVPLFTESDRPVLCSRTESIVM